MAKVAFIDEKDRTDWLDGLKANNPKVVRKLYADHFPAVRRYVMENRGRITDAEDMFQEAFLALWLRVKEDGFKGDDPGGFLFQVAKNKWLDVLRSAGKRQMRVLASEHMDRVADGLTDDGTEERIVRLREVYGQLDAKCREVLDLFYFERKDLSAIAAALGVQEDSIRTIKYRCMMKLRAWRRKIGGDKDERP